MNRHGSKATRRSRWKVYLTLGRVSNLPTIWTNGLAATALAGAGHDDVRLALLLLALSLFYTGGMFLNDAFDHRYDLALRPERPIPSGWIDRRTVFAVGFGLLALAEGLLAAPDLFAGRPPNTRLMVLGLALILLIIYYDARHKVDPLSPVVMALCRAMVYLVSAAAMALALAREVWGGATMVAVYLIALSYAAKQESIEELTKRWPLVLLCVPFVYAWPVAEARNAGSLVFVFFLGWVLSAIALLRRGGPRNIRRAVVRLIAGISLLDALLIAGAAAGPPLWVWLAVTGFLLTLVLQRVVPGT